MKRLKLGISRKDQYAIDGKQAASPRDAYVIEPSPGWKLIDFRELWKYRELSFFLVWREIKGRYAQSILGVGWAVIQPVAYMIVFSVVFGNLLDVDSDGVPYAVFSYTALVPWIFFSQGLTGAAGSLTANRGLFSKVYFPRLILPLSAVLARLVDFAIAFLLVFALMAWFGMTPTIWVLIAPLLIVLMLLTAAGLGMWLTALAIQYRDINFGLAFAVQLMMYTTPVVYSVSAIPDRFRLIYSLNPMVGVIEGFRSALLNTNPMPWDLLVTGSIGAVVALVTGALYFRRMERIFADVA